MKKQTVNKNRKLYHLFKKLGKTVPLLIFFYVFGFFNPSFSQSNDIKTIVIDPGHGGKDVGAGGDHSREAMVALNIGLKVKEMMAKDLPDIKVLMTRESDVLPGNLNDKNDALRWRANFANENNADLFISIHLNSTVSNQKYVKRKTGTKQQKYYVTVGKGSKAKKVAKYRTVNVYERVKVEPSVYGTQTYILASDWYKGKVASASRTSAIKDYVDPDSGEIPELDPVEARVKAQQYAKYFFQKSLTLASYVEEEFGAIGRKSWGVWQRDWAGAQGIYVLSATQMPSILIETGFIDYPEEEAYLNSSEGQKEMAKSIVAAIKRYRSVLNNPENLLKQPVEGEKTD